MKDRCIVSFRETQSEVEVGTHCYILTPSKTQPTPDFCSTTEVSPAISDTDPWSGCVILLITPVRQAEPASLLIDVHYLSYANPFYYDILIHLRCFTLYRPSFWERLPASPCN